MKRTALLIVLICQILNIVAQRRSVYNGALIPQPVSLITHQPKYYVVPPKLTIIFQKNDDLKRIATRLSKDIAHSTASSVILKEGNTVLPGSILITLTNDKTIPAEGYRLKVTDKNILLIGSTPAGIYYGVQTLLQLFPNSPRNNIDGWSHSLSIPSVTIEDYPRFGWRGLMLDVSRHFFTKEEVKEFIDDMVRYKFNLLHWHLTDDQGWRIEIKSFPKLTSVGAWRVDKTGTFGTFSTPMPDEPKKYGGFYTQEDIREVVQYAKERFVNIMPEVDVPGHSLAAIAAYPELTCTPGTYHVNSGERLMIWPPGGHFYGTIDNALCPAKEFVYEFMDKVFGEIAQLFPFEYIHMGGDETARNFWEKSDLIKELMQKENLKNLDEVQSYFVKRMEKIINSKGKKLIGWDEILDGGLAPNAAVMSWRGMTGGIKAAKDGHEVVMSPTNFAYLDYMQGDAMIEPPVYASLRLKTAYQFEPLPDSVDAKLIKGGQGNIWTEQIYNTRHLQYMVWPRAMALAEVLWSPRNKKDWPGFVDRIEKHLSRLTNSGIKYSPALYDPEFIFTKKDSTQIILTMNTEANNLDIHYSFDNSFPDQYYPKYTEPVLVPKDAATLKAITYRNGGPIGRMIIIPIAEMKKRAKIQ
jgi:hexosaminidase